MRRRSLPAAQPSCSAWRCWGVPLPTLASPRRRISNAAGLRNLVSRKEAGWLRASIQITSWRLWGRAGRGKAAVRERGGGAGEDKVERAAGRARLEGSSAAAAAAPGGWVEGDALARALPDVCACVYVCVLCRFLPDSRHLILSSPHPLPPPPLFFGCQTHIFAVGVF